MIIALILLKKFEIVPPIIIFVTLTGVKGKNFRRLKQDIDTVQHRYAIDRDILYLPEVFVKNSDSKAEEFLRRIFDALYQASGFMNCHNYNEQGKRIR